MKRCTHPPELEAAVERVRACFPTSTDLLSQQYRKAQRATASEGFCSVASEAVWQDAQRYGYKGRNASWYAPSGERLSHWWLVSPDDCILDPTADQFSPKQLRKVYAAGKPGGFPGIRRPEGVPVVGGKARKLRERAGLGRARGDGMARKIKLGGTPEEHRRETERLLGVASRSARKNTCEGLVLALTASTSALSIAPTVDDQYFRARDMMKSVLRKLGTKSCQFTVEKKMYKGRVNESVSVRPGKKCSR